MIRMQNVSSVQAFCRIEKCRINIWHFEFRVFSLLHFFTSFNFPLMLVCFQAKVHSCRFEILHRYCHSVCEYCKMNHLIFGLMQISSPGYYLTWIFPSGKNCHAVEFPGFKCDSKIAQLKLGMCLLTHFMAKTVLRNQFMRSEFMVFGLFEGQ